MIEQMSHCLGHYDFEEIAGFAKSRFVDGIATLTLLDQAQSQREREEIALVAMLDIVDDQIRTIELHCPYADACKITDCRQKLRSMISERLSRSL